MNMKRASLERDRERDRERQRQRQTDKERQMHADMHRETQRDRDTERHRETEREKKKTKKGWNLSLNKGCILSLINVFVRQSDLQFWSPLSRLQVSNSLR